MYTHKRPLYTQKKPTRSLLSHSLTHARRDRERKGGREIEKKREPQLLHTRTHMWVSETVCQWRIHMWVTHVSDSMLQCIHEYIATYTCEWHEYTFVNTHVKIHCYILSQNAIATCTCEWHEYTFVNTHVSDTNTHSETVCSNVFSHVYSQMCIRVTHMCM